MPRIPCISFTHMYVLTHHGLCFLMISRGIGRHSGSSRHLYYSRQARDTGKKILVCFGWSGDLSTVGGVQCLAVTLSGRGEWRPPRARTPTSPCLSGYLVAGKMEGVFRSRKAWWCSGSVRQGDGGCSQFRGLAVTRSEPPMSPSCSLCFQRSGCVRHRKHGRDGNT